MLRAAKFFARSTQRLTGEAWQLFGQQRRLNSEFQNFIDGGDVSARLPVVRIEIQAALDRDLPVIPVGRVLKRLRVSGLDTLRRKKAARRGVSMHGAHARVARWRMLVMVPRSTSWSLLILRAEVPIRK